MPFVFANNGLFTLLNTAVTGTTDFRCLVLTTAGILTDAQVEDLNFVSDLLAASGMVEANNLNYARQDLAGVQIVKDNTNNRVAITASAPTMFSVGAGAVWGRIAYYVNNGVDTVNPLIGIDTPPAPLTPNGNVTLPPLIIHVTDIST